MFLREMVVWDMRVTGMQQERIGKRVGVCQVQVGRILKQIRKKAADFGKEQGLKSSI